MNDVVIPVSVVIPTYGRDQILVNTIEALLQLKKPAAEIIVVDQTEQHQPATEKQLKAWQHTSKINWLRLPVPSIPHAMNQGLIAAKHRVVLFLDDDIVPDSELVASHAQLQLSGQAKLIAGRVLQPWHNGHADAEGHVPFLFNTLESREVTDFMGGNFSVDREQALGIGGFDENFVHVAYRFEAEFAFRWCKSGQRIRYNPNALIHHLKVSSGGTRMFGNHLRTLSPAHTVGAHYFLLRTMGFESIAGICSRIFSSVKTRHHLMRPWWIPVTLFSELSGLVWAFWLALRGPRYIN